MDKKVLFSGLKYVLLDENFVVEDTFTADEMRKIRVKEYDNYEEHWDIIEKLLLAMDEILKVRTLKIEKEYPNFFENYMLLKGSHQQ